MKMKKLLFLISIILVQFMVLSFISKFNVLADESESIIKDLILSVNNPPSASSLEIDGYTIQMNNVNFNEVGTYTITYEDKSGSLYNRNVYIINDQYNSITNEPVYQFTMYDDVYNIIQYDIFEKCFFLVVQYKRGMNDNFCVLLYKDGLENWRIDYYGKTLKTSFIKGKDYKTKLCCYYHDAYPNYYYLTLDMFKRENILTNQFNFHPSGVYYIESYDAAQFLLQDRIVKIKESTKVLESEVKLNTLSSEINLSEYYEQDQFVEDGFITYVFYKRIKKNEFCFYKINRMLMLVDTYSVTIKEGYTLKHLGSNTFIAYKITNDFGSDKSTTESGRIDYQVIQYQKEKGITNTHVLYENKIEWEELIDKINFNRNNDMIHLNVTFVSSKMKNYKIGDNFYQELKDNRTLTSKINYYTSNHKTYFSKNNGLEIIYASKSEKVIPSTLHKNEIFVFENETMISKSQDYSYTSYGLYEKELALELDYYSILISYQYYYEDGCNLRDNEVYQIGSILTFLGEATLNNQRIESGTTMNEVGNYTLIIQGINEQKKISFTIENLNESATYLSTINQTTQDNKTIQKIAATYTNNEKLIEEETFLVNCEKSDETTIHPILYVIMSVILSIVTLIVFGFMMNKRKKKW